MRRFAGLLLAFALASPGGFAALGATESAQCAMACHANGAAGGAICCRVAGSDGPVFKLCGESRDGLPLPTVFRMATARTPEALSSPAPTGRASVLYAARPIARSSEPADPVPLRLS